MEHEQHLALLAKTATGDQQAFQSLYEATSSQLYAVTLKILRKKEWAEDVVQDAYVKIWHNADQYQAGKGTVLTWMISIARYRALDLIRYYKIRNEYELDDSTLIEDDLPVERDEQEKKQLDICMEQLQSQQKQAIHLAFFKGFSHQEVTEHLGAPLGSTKSMIRRGMQLLKRCLGI